MNIQGINIHEHEFCPKDSKCLLNIYSVFMNIHSSGGEPKIITFLKIKRPISRLILDLER